MSLSRLCIATKRTACAHVVPHWHRSGGSFHGFTIIGEQPPQLCEQVSSTCTNPLRTSAFIARRAESTSAFVATSRACAPCLGQLLRKPFYQLLHYLKTREHSRNRGMAQSFYMIGSMLSMHDKTLRRDANAIDRPMYSGYNRMTDEPTFSGHSHRAFAIDTPRLQGTIA